MGFWIIVIAATFGISGFAEKLTYYSPEPQFEIEHSGKSIILKTPKLTLKVDAKPCNQGEVDYFWKQAVHEFERNPRITRAPRGMEFAELDNDRRMIMPTPAAERLRSLDKAFFTLMAMDKRLCR